LDKLEGLDGLDKERLDEFDRELSDMDVKGEMAKLNAMYIRIGERMADR
jgi:hypothetical protein